MAARRYIYGWQCWFRALYQARTKKRGAGPMKWKYAFKMAACYRYLVDGQQRKPPRFPRYLRGNGWRNQQQTFRTKDTVITP